MNTFTWLLIGHLIGDWLLQNEWMAQGKKERLVTLAGLSHFTIYTVAVTSMLWISEPVKRSPEFYLFFGLLVFMSHWLIDATNLVEGWIRLYRQSNLALMRIMVDQTLHLLVLAALAISLTWPLLA